MLAQHDLFNLVENLAAAQPRVCILGNDGRILAVSESWKIFGASNNLATHNHGIGLRYQDYCCGDEGAVIREKLLEVLGGTTEGFVEFYDCSPTNRPKTFVVSAVVHRSRGEWYVAVSHMVARDFILPFLTTGAAEEKHHEDVAVPVTLRRDRGTITEFTAVMSPLLRALDALRDAHGAAADIGDPVAENGFQELLVNVAKQIDRFRK